MGAVAFSFIAYTVAIAALGVYSSRFSKRSESDFLLADRGLGAWVSGLSAAASAESGWVTLGLVGYAFETGIAALWVVPGTVVAFLFNWFVLAPRLRACSDQPGVLTLTDVLAKPYGRGAGILIRLTSICIMLAMLTTYAAAQFNSAGKLFSATFGWPYWMGVIVGSAIVLLYTVIGGFRAIAWTDVVQAIFMFIAVTVVPFVLVYHIGGFDDLWQRLQQLDDNQSLTHPFASKSGAALLGFVALWIGVPLGNPGQPHVLIRLMAAKDKRAIRRAGVISTAWVMVLFSGAVFFGIAARAYYGTLSDPEQALPLVATSDQLVPGLFGGLIVAAIFAAVCSTADSQLLVAASAVSHDLYSGVLGRNLSLSRKLSLDRATVLLFGGLALAIAVSDVGSIFDFVLAYGWAGLGAGFGPPLILRLLWKGTTGWGISGGMIVGFTTAIVWRMGFPDLHAWVYNLIPAFFAALLATWVISLASSDPVERRDDRQQN